MQLNNRNMESPKPITTIRISKISRNLDISISKLVSILKNEGCMISNNPNSKIDAETFDLMAIILERTYVNKEKIEELKQIYFNQKKDRLMNIKEIDVHKLLEYKVIGIIDHLLGGKSARIKVIALLNKNNTPINLTGNESEVYFPPKGYIFEPGFFHNFKYHENEIVSFYIEENERAEFGQDKYRLKVNASEIKNYGINARKITGFKKNKLATDLSLIHAEDDTSDGKFYGISDKYILGELRIRNGIIEPALHNRIKFWDLEKENILHYNGHIKLHHCPTGESMVLDCMNDKQLFDWFREELKKIEPDYVNILDTQAKWRTEIPTLFTQTDKETHEVNKVRFERIEEKFKYLDLSIADIKTLTEKSISLRDAFNKAIENHKEELKEEYKTQLEEFQKDFEKQKFLIEKQIDTLQQSKIKKEGVINDLKTEIENLTQTIGNLNQNKVRILADYSIIKDVFANTDKNEKNQIKQDSFVIESYETKNEPVAYQLSNAKEQFLLDFKFHLWENSILPNFANKILNIFSVYKAVFVKDIRMGLSYAATTNNAFYIIQQVEPDWLHFSDFWNNGLGAIWQSAHLYPEKPHFLFLEDINMSSPECYARPLLDMITGIRKLIPFGKTPYPENLKIITTKISTENPEIGLPLNEQTFKGWGCVGFKGDIYKKSEEEYKSQPGIFNTKTIQSFALDNAEIEMIQSDVKSDFNILFDVE